MPLIGTWSASCPYTTALTRRSTSSRSHVTKSPYVHIQHDRPGNVRCVFAFPGVARRNVTQMSSRGVAWPLSSHGIMRPSSSHGVVRRSSLRHHVAVVFAWHCMAAVFARALHCSIFALPGDCHCAAVVFASPSGLLSVHCHLRRGHHRCWRSKGRGHLPSRAPQTGRGLPAQRPFVPKWEGHAPA
jgi:hypothetical protein